MAKKGENIYLRKDGRWEGRYIKGRNPDGKPLFGYVYGRQYSEVKRKLVTLKAELYKSESLPVIFGKGKFNDWMYYWLEFLRKPYIKPETYMGYRRIVDNHISPVLGHFNINEITQENIQDMVNELRQKLAASTLHGVCRLLKSIFNAAIEKGLLKYNPYRNIKLPKTPKSAARVLTSAEQKRFEKAAYDAGEFEYLVCLYTGIRVGELCALRWQDVDFENHMLHIRHSIHRVPDGNGSNSTKLVVGTPKSNTSIRDIPLPYFIENMLKDHKKEHDVTACDYIFKGTKCMFMDPRTMQQRIAKRCKELGIYGVHMHTLRHTFATRCLERGIRYEVLCEFLGHSSPQITLKHYAHCTPETKRQSMDMMEWTL